MSPMVPGEDPNGTATTTGVSMPLPGDLTTITLTGTLPNAAGSNLPGIVTVTPTTTLTDTTGHVVIPMEPVKTLFSGGSFSVPGLATTDNTHIAQNGGWAYTVTIEVGAQYLTGTYLIPSTYGASVSYDELVPAGTLPNVSAYGLLAGTNDFTGSNSFTEQVALSGGITTSAQATRCSALRAQMRAPNL